MVLSFWIALSFRKVTLNEMVTTRKNPGNTPENCENMIRPVRDALEVLNGKWKLAIIGSLSFGTKRFKQISKEVNGITDKVLSKELKDLEANQLVKRDVYDTFPPTVEYSITPHGQFFNFTRTPL